MDHTDARYMEGLKALLHELFSVSAIEQVNLVYDRYRCLNYHVVTSSGTYFLKQYRGRSNEEVFETKFAEGFFAQHSIPIILPIQDRFGRPAFSYHGEWFSLFPFIDERQPAADRLSDTFLHSLGTRLAALHRVGSLIRLDAFRRLRLWDVEQFTFEMVDLKQMFENEQAHPGIPPIVLGTMEKKIHFVTQESKRAHEFSLPFDCLLHGDPIYQNTFINDQDEVIAFVDLEDACVGPRAYEVGRAVLINCFEDGWGEEQFRRARLFFHAYQHVFPLSLPEFRQGVEMYMIKNAHKLWFEAKHLFGQNDETRRCYKAHALRIDHLHEDWGAFCKKIYSTG